MKQQDFEKKHKATWEALEKLMQKDHDPGALKNLPDYFQQASHHLAIAKQRRYSTLLVKRLNDLVVEAHGRYYGELPRFKSNFIYYLYAGFPLVLRKNRRFVLSGCALFFLPFFLFTLLCAINDDLIYSVMDYESVKSLENMYDPGSKALGRERESDSDIAMFGFYIKHNIGISFRTFAGGILFGLGSIFFLMYNGIILGSVFGHMAKGGYTETFFPFVAGHGSFELMAIALSGAAGLKLGWALLAPGVYTRLSALKLAAKEAITIIYGSTVMLLIAAFIEAFWSSSSTLPIMVKYVVGLSLWVLVLAYLGFAGRGYAIK